MRLLGKLEKNSSYSGISREFFERHLLVKTINNHVLIVWSYRHPDLVEYRNAMNEALVVDERLYLSL